MTIEIHRPELEALIQHHLQSGRFHDVEDILMHALQTVPEIQADSDTAFGRGLIEVCAMVKWLTDDVDFSRNPSTDRPLDLA